MYEDYTINVAAKILTGKKGVTSVSPRDLYIFFSFLQD